MRWILYPLTALFALGVLCVAMLATAAMLAWPKLPSLEALTDYRPKIPLQVYTADGYLLGEFGEERRALVSIDEVPVQLKEAILAVEDRRFYEHQGIDFVGILRAAVAYVITNDRAQGASTITMQVARNFYLSPDRKFIRKFYEILLALKIDHELEKDRILELYINQIFLGHRAYGFSAAARTYFGKPLSDITLGEAAMLAGLPKGPSSYNPISHPQQAAARQRHVLRRMLAADFIDDATYRHALAEPLTIATTRDDDDKNKSLSHYGDHVAEMARRIAVDQFGEEEAYQLGLRIITTIKRDEQIAAYRAARENVFEYDKRHGYRGPESFVDLSSVRDEQLDQLESRLAETRDYDDLPAALVLDANPQSVTVYRQGKVFQISGKGLSFAAPMLNERAPQTRRIRRGAIIRIRAAGDDNWQITQLPEVETALVSIDANSGAIRALVGGFDFERSKFNHVTQAQRQPGSSFKPFIYSAALERGYSPASYESDEPLYFPAGVTGSKPWQPRNYDGKSDGVITVREALTRSKNLVSIRLLQSITPKFAQDYIARFGFNPERHPAYLTMALGAGSVTPWEMAGAYAVFANGGFKIDPYIVQEITNAEGRVLAVTDPPVADQSAPRVIDPRNAWLMDSMLRDVVNRGTARRATSLKRSDLAGKTGTTNDYVDAWFAGYTPDVVAISWIGYDQPRNLGRGETGGRAALPAWIEYMQTALKGMPEKRHPRPNGLVTYRPEGKNFDDYYYQENEQPAPLHEELPDIPELEYFLPPRGQPGFPLGPGGAENRTPAPVEDRSPISVRP